MKLVKAEEIEFFYIFPEDDLIKEETTLINNLTLPKSPDFPNLPMGKYVPEKLIKTLQNGTDTRLAIYTKSIRKVHSIKDFFYAYETRCLFWTNKDINLKELDQKIREDSYTDEDFHSAIITRLQYVFCHRNCLNKYLALAYDPEIYELMYFPIALAKHKSYSDYFVKKIHMTKTLRCPNCNESLGIIVVRFFNKEENLLLKKCNKTL